MTKLSLELYCKYRDHENIKRLQKEYGRIELYVTDSGNIRFYKNICVQDGYLDIIYSSTYYPAEMLDDYAVLESVAVDLYLRGDVSVKIFGHKDGNRKYLYSKLIKEMYEL